MLQWGSRRHAVHQCLSQGKESRGQQDLDRIRELTVQQEWQCPADPLYMYPTQRCCVAQWDVTLVGHGVDLAPAASLCRRQKAPSSDVCRSKAERASPGHARAGGKGLC